MCGTPWVSERAAQRPSSEPHLSLALAARCKGEVEKEDHRNAHLTIWILVILWANTQRTIA